MVRKEDKSFFNTNQTNLRNKIRENSKVPRGRLDVSTGYQPGNATPQQEMESQRDGPKTNPKRTCGRRNMQPISFKGKILKSENLNGDFGTSR